MKRAYLLATLTTIAVLLCAGISLFIHRRYESPAPIPIDLKLTPGEVLSSSVDEVCTSGYTETLPTVSVGMREKVFLRYHIYQRRPGEYQIAHLIPLELGGSYGILNLFPIRVDANQGGYQVGVATRKQLADSLHRDVCFHRIGLEEAQKTMRSTDWQSEYKKTVNTELPLYRK